MPILLGDDIPAGMSYVHDELSKGRSACWVGRGPAGFALLTATARASQTPRGVVVAVSLTPALLRKLQARIAELLDESSPPPIDGIRLGKVIGE